MDATYEETVVYKTFHTTEKMTWSLRDRKHRLPAYFLGRNFQATAQGRSNRPAHQIMEGCTREERDTETQESHKGFTQSMRQNCYQHACYEPPRGINSHPKHWEGISASHTELGITNPVVESLARSLTVHIGMWKGARNSPWEQEPSALHQSLLQFRQKIIKQDAKVQSVSE